MKYNDSALWPLTLLLTCGAFANPLLPAKLLPSLLKINEGRAIVRNMAGAASAVTNSASNRAALENFLQMQPPAVLERLHQATLAIESGHQQQARNYLAEVTASARWERGSEGPSYARTGLLARMRGFFSGSRETVQSTNTLPREQRPLLESYNHSLPNIERGAYRELNKIGGTPGFIRFNEFLDQNIRKNSTYVEQLLQLTFNRLPYLENREINIFLSGGIVDLWTATLKAYAENNNLRFNIIQLTGNLSFARSDRKDVPPFPDEIIHLVADHPSIFLDDTYTNGGTAQAVREPVENNGGQLHGVFVVYEGGKGDPASLYKSGRMNRRPPSMRNFPLSPNDWEPIDEGQMVWAIELDGTLFQKGTKDITIQGQKLLSFLENKGIEVVFLNRRRVSRNPPPEILHHFGQLKTSSSLERADLAIGNWGREFRGDQTSVSLRFSGALIETVEIGDYREEGIYSQDLLDENYFLNTLAQFGLLRPVYDQQLYDSAQKIESAAVAIFDLRRAGLKPVGSHDLYAIYALGDPREKTDLLGKIAWEELTSEQKDLMLTQAKIASNSFEIGAYINIAKDSRDIAWRPLLENWVSEWQGVSRGWQTFLRANALGALEGLSTL